MAVAGIHQHMKVMIYLPGICSKSGGHGNVADHITPIMADFPINAPSVWIGILATLCLACHISDRHPT
jgi:hypothetical protein